MVPSRSLADLQEKLTEGLSVIMSSPGVCTMLSGLWEDGPLRGPPLSSGLGLHLGECPTGSDHPHKMKCECPKPHLNIHGHSFSQVPPVLRGVCGYLGVTWLLGEATLGSLEQSSLAKVLFAFFFFFF